MNQLQVHGQFELFGRKRVDDVISSAMKQRLLIISANSGAGKTTAVESYLSQLDRHQAIWVTFSNANNYASQFWSMFVEAVAIWDGVQAAEMMRAGFPETIQEKNRYLDLLCKAASTTMDPIIVFDNFHLLLDGPIKELVSITIEATCKQISYILIGQEELSVEVPTGIIPAYLTNQDLQFSKDDIRTYYHAMNLHITESALMYIYSLTQGWAIAVYLVGVSLQRGRPLSRPDVDDAVGLVHRIFDAEIFLHFSLHIQEALILSSLLEEIHPQMVIELNMMSQEELVATFREIPFIHYNTASNAYCFHPLYRQFLVSKQILISNEKHKMLCSMAGEWYTKQGRLVEPVRYYIAAGDYLHVKHFLSGVDLPTVTIDVCAQYHSLLEQIPECFVENHPLLWLYQSLVHDRCEPNQNDSLLLAAKNNREWLLSTLEGREAWGELQLTLAYHYVRKGCKQWVEYMIEASKYLPQGTRIWTGKNYSFVSNASCLHMSEDTSMDEIVASYEQSVPYMKITLRDYGRGLEHLAVCEAHYYRDEYEKAMHFAGLAVDTATAHRQWDIASNAQYICTQVSIAHSSYADVDFFRNSCHQYAELETRRNVTLIADIADWSFYFHMGEPEKAAHWITSQADVNLLLHHVNAGRELYPMAAYLVYTKKFYPALAFIQTAMNICNNTGRSITILYLQILRAVVFNLMGQQEKAVDHLYAAYQLAIRDRIKLPFGETGEYILSVIENAQKQPNAAKIPLAWLRDIEKQTRSYIFNVNRIKRVYYNKTISHLDVPLTPREKEILSLLCAGLEIKDISETLGIARGTVKFNLANIYRKLGVNNRNDAVRLAKDTRII